MVNALLFQETMTNGADLMEPSLRRNIKEAIVNKKTMKC